MNFMKLTVCCYTWGIKESVQRDDAAEMVY